MAIKSDAQRKAVAKYNAANYEQIQMRVEKGNKSIIQAHAQQQGESLNAFLVRAVFETMERDTQQNHSRQADTLSDNTGIGFEISKG